MCPGNLLQFSPFVPNILNFQGNHESIIIIDLIPRFLISETGFCTVKMKGNRKFSEFSLDEWEVKNVFIWRVRRSVNGLISKSHGECVRQWCQSKNSDSFILNINPNQYDVNDVSNDVLHFFPLGRALTFSSLSPLWSSTIDITSTFVISLQLGLLAWQNTKFVGALIVFIFVGFIFSEHTTNQFQWHWYGLVYLIFVVNP